MPSAAPDRDSEGPGLLQVLTLVLWLTWVVIGVIGLALSEEHPQETPAKAPMPPLQAELLDVELTQEPIAVPESPPADASPPLPAMAEPPALPAVALPSPAIAFAVPVEGPVRVVDSKLANLARVPIAARPVAELITNEVGERQPKPDYPTDALWQGQEGVVGIRFTVTPDGKVLSAEVFSPSPWPLLNQAALRVVRVLWRVPPGNNPLKEVFITFKINRT